MKLSIIGLSILLAAACNTPTPREDVGRAQMALTGTGSSGTLYRLRSGLFNITGLETATVNTEDDPSRTSVSLTLKVGAYLATLQPGWFMEKQTGPGMFEMVNAVLISSNPQAFSIQDQGVTQVRFKFNAGNDVIELGHGVAVVGIDVDDCGPSGCPGQDQDVDGFPAPADCNDGDPTVFPGALEVCDGQDNNCDGIVDESGCVPGVCGILSQSGCPAGQACYLDGATAVAQCQAPGPLEPGDVCNDINDCEGGGLCYDLFGTGGPVCFQWCDVSLPDTCVQPGYVCAPAGLQENLGICIP